MIGYPITKAALETMIEAEKPGWLQRAKERTEKFRTLGHFEEDSSIWGEIKPVYMEFQGHSKCAYCERKLESVHLGKGEQDVEHFRPKGSVKKWKLPKELSEQGIKATPPPETSGYYLLPYHVFNYAAACKPCNSALKKDYFPIAGTYQMDGEDPTALKDEKPYLIYPLGDGDDLPESLIQFHGVSPQPVQVGGHGRKRALVTIEFFRLDDFEKRKNLIEERARIIIALHPQLDKLAKGATGAEAATAQAIIKGFTAATTPHTNCALSFKQLFENDPLEAEAIFNSAVELILSIS